MKFRGTGKKAEDMRLNMTAMIDIVFQLLVFFILTFKVTAMETDFNIKMPLQSQSTDITDVTPTIISVTLKANDQRDIAGIDADNNGMAFESFSTGDIYKQLTDFIERSLAGEGDPSLASETEVEFIIDPPLKYRFTVLGIEAVSGRKLPDGTTKTLIEKIKFRSQ